MRVELSLDMLLERDSLSFENYIYILYWRGQPREGGSSFGSPHPPTLESENKNSSTLMCSWFIWNVPMAYYQEWNYDLLYAISIVDAWNFSYSSLPSTAIGCYDQMTVLSTYNIWLIVLKKNMVFTFPYFYKEMSHYNHWNTIHIIW